MVRRLAVLLRRGLFVAGVVLLAWWAASFLYRVGVWLPEPGDYTIISVWDGGVSLWWRSENFTMDLDRVIWEAYPVQWEWHSLDRTLLPRVHYQSQVPDGRGGIAQDLQIKLPLWILAVACLSWPVASFLLARRRRPGFAVEPGPGDAPSRAGLVQEESGE